MCCGRPVSSRFLGSQVISLVGRADHWAGTTLAVPNDLDGVEVALPPILDAHARLAQAHDAVVVEGVGGWAAPLSASLMQADLVRALRLPVVLVVGLRLGCLNHALLSARAIAGDGAHLAGWIASQVDPAMERVDDNLAMLRARLPAPCWGVLPHAPGADTMLLAQHLRVPVLVE